MLNDIITEVGRHAISSPYRIAVCDSSSALDFETLIRFSSIFSTVIQKYGCDCGDRVVMLASRRSIVVAAMLGVFISRCIHVPIDTKIPAGRIHYILDDIKPRLVIVDDELSPYIPEGFQVFLVSDLLRLLSDLPKLVAVNAGTNINPEDEAYCIYTSGSTGRPKGVMIKHSSIAHFIDGWRDVYDVTTSSKCTSFSPLHFDAYLIDILYPLAQGATLFLYDQCISPNEILLFLQKKQITHFSAWGMMLTLLTQADNFNCCSLPHLKTVMTGADVPNVKSVHAWMLRNAGVRVVNGYGPTEATCASAACIIREREPERREPYPIGKPLKHIKITLIDELGKSILEPNIPGELLVGGQQVMSRYWNSPEQTENVIVIRDGVRFYRTGDICTLMEDGSLLYIGRRDHEVNIGGYRVHLNEIKRVIESFSSVILSEVVCLDSQYGENIIAAAVQIDLDNDVRSAALFCEKIKKKIAMELPAYMVPRHVAAFEDFPRLSSGKPDRKEISVILKNQIFPNRR